MKRVSKTKVKKSYDTDFVAPSNREITWSWNMKGDIPLLEFYITGKLLWKQGHVFGYPTKFELMKCCNPEFEGPEKDFPDRFHISVFDQPQRTERRKSMSRSSSQVFKEKWGVNPTAAMRVIRSVVLKTQYDPIYEYDRIFKPSRTLNSKMERKGVTRSRYADNIISHIDVVEQMKVDGQDNLLPLGIAKGLTVSELKTQYGKNPWKRISKFSRTHNRELSTLDFNIGQALSSKPYSHTILYKKVAKQFGRVVAHRPEMVLAYTETLLKEKGTYAEALRTENQEIFRISTYIYDMARGGEIVNKNWSTRRIKEEHDAWSIRQRAILAAKRREQEEMYKCEFATSEPKQFGAVKATILNTVEKIELEGDLMGHCVGGYSRRSHSGDYRVVRVEKDGYICTLGLQESSGHSRWDYPEGFHGPVRKSFSFQQMYGKYNEHVKDEDILAAKEDIIKWVNEEYYEYRKGN